jgi:hypothetical protein
VHSHGADSHARAFPISHLSPPAFRADPSSEDLSRPGAIEPYRLAGMTPGLFKKHGKSTLVDFDVLDQILDALPAAVISKPRT